ncbi:tetratricopeptide repeat protein [Saccharothrix saharensis]|uniref:tetratricopeptide repeat protein n=1 Tax=Saccharothrix saharensis TaxID=571190 RepID=UPI001479303D|nr:tetratricopeptide repeat protein [Saccharothrix saharensis]
MEAPVTGAVVQAGAIHGDVHVHGRQAGRLPFRFGVVPPVVDGYQLREVDLAAPVLVLSGMGGVGKTQLAAGIARDAWTSGGIDVLVWVTASSRQSIASDFAWCARQLTGLDDGDPERAAGHFLNWLGDTAANWLVVVDDLRAPGDLNGLWPPPSTSGRVVVTTRRRDAALAGPGRRRVDVEVFTAAESAAFLRARLTDHRGLAVGADRLAEVLGHLPLALAQATAYLVDRRITCDEYLTRFTERHRPLVALSPEPDSLPDQHRGTTAAVWGLSVELADRLQPTGLATPMLRFVSLLSPHAIPIDVFAAPALFAYLEAVVGRPVGAEEPRDALHCLHRLSLITCGPDDSGVRVHTLIQRVTRDEFASDDVGTLARVAADALVWACPRGQSNAPLPRPLRDNIDVLLSHVEETLSRPRFHHILVKKGNDLGYSGYPGAAHGFLARLHGAAARRFGVLHHDTLILGYLSAYWQAQGMRPADAAALLRSTADRLARVQGGTSPFALTARRDIAYHEGRAGHHRRAVALLEDVLPHIRAVFGERSTTALLTMSSLAFWLGEAGRTRAAMSIMRDYFDILEESLGTEHPDVLTARQNLGLLLSDTGDHTAAIALLTGVRDDQTRILGADHPDTLRTRHNLAVTLAHGGDPHGAAREFRALHLDEVRLHGPDHPDSRSVLREAVRWTWAANLASEW